MPATSCTRCTPLPKPPEKPKVPKKSPRRHKSDGTVETRSRATADFALEDAMSLLLDGVEYPDSLRRLLLSSVVPAFKSSHDLGCIHYRYPGSSWERGMLAPLLTGEMVIVSAPRIAYACVYPEGLDIGQNVDHYCETVRDGDVRRVCVNPIHLYVKDKEETDDATHEEFNEYPDDAGDRREAVCGFGIEVSG